MANTSRLLYSRIRQCLSTGQPRKNGFRLLKGIPIKLLINSNLFVIGLAIFSFVTVKPSIAAPIAVKRATYEEDFKRIDSYRSLHDLAAMEKTCDELLSKWKSKDSQNFIKLSCEACEVLSSINFHDMKQFTLAQKYALAALNSSASKSTEDQAGLVMYGLSHDFGKVAMGTTSWVERRKDLAQWWFSTWQRINQGIDPNFDPKAHHYQVNVDPPADAHQLVFSGMSPANIKDPAVRQEYEQAIKRNQETINLVNQQRDLRDLKGTFEPVAKRYIIQVYSVPPSNPVELDRLLKSYIADEATRQSIIESVNKENNPP